MPTRIPSVGVNVCEHPKRTEGSSRLREAIQASQHRYLQLLQCVLLIFLSVCVCIESILFGE